MDKTITLTETEQKQLIELLDIAQKAVGIQGSHVIASFIDKLVDKKEVVNG